MSEPILIIDDDPVQRRLLQAAVAKAGHQAIVAENGAAALESLEGGQGRDAKVVILDLVMPGLDGNAVLAEMRQRGIEKPVIVQTAQGGIDTVVRAMRAGAFDFVVKPVSPDRLLTAIRNALKFEAFDGGKARSGESSRVSGFADIVTTSPAMERLLRVAQKAAMSNIPILIEGESGVGKELVARAIRASGARKAKPFVTVNCGAIPENLVESILFGHEKGSFTGASERHIGKFVEADGGTLFLDEIGDLPMDVQVKLLRAVQEGEVDPVGARSTVKVDIRLISATHRNLLQLVKEGRFREDLFYRLNVFPIHVPPLRDRREDIPLLVSHFMRKAAPADMRHRVTAIEPRALSLLCAYDWPGNIRQLENAVVRAMVLCETGTLSVDDFPQIRAQVEAEAVFGLPTPPVSMPASSVSAQQPASEPPTAEPAWRGGIRPLDGRGNVRSLAAVEQEMIEFALDHYGGQMSEVARRLGIGRSTLYRKLKEYGIDPDAPRGPSAGS